MSLLFINPRYRHLFRRCGLAAAEDFMCLPGVIVSGHPDRHVSRVFLDNGRVLAFLKKEHRVPWRDRLHNLLAGFGWVAKSVREMYLLQQVSAVGLDVPEVLAAGEIAGRAFLLMKAVPEAVELRTFLQTASREDRRFVARQLGVLLGYMHSQGIDHPDLFSKHIFVRRLADGGWGFSVLDWQRSRVRPVVPFAHRCRDLAALDATLADDLASARDRLAFLHAYLQASGGAKNLRPRMSGLGCGFTWLLPRVPVPVGRAGGVNPLMLAGNQGVNTPRSPNDRRAGGVNPLIFAQMARAIRALSQRLLTKRRVRESRHPPLPAESQTLIWLDGEALCVTQECHQEFHGHLPGWLGVPDGSVERTVERQEVSLPGNRAGRLVRRASGGFWRWLWTKICRGRWVAPEVEQAATLYRLQRYGIVQGRLLAMGQRCHRPWRRESFLLTEPVPGAVPLHQWLRDALASRLRWAVLRELGTLVRRLHEAGFSLADATDHLTETLVVCPHADGGRVALQGVEGIHRYRMTFRRLRQDFRVIARHLGEVWSQADKLRFLRSYFNQRPLPRHVRRLARVLLQGPRAREVGR